MGVAASPGPAVLPSTSRVPNVTTADHPADKTLDATQPVPGKCKKSCGSLGEVGRLGRGRTFTHRVTTQEQTE